MPFHRRFVGWDQPLIPVAAKQIATMLQNGSDGNGSDGNGSDGNGLEGNGLDGASGSLVPSDPFADSSSSVLVVVPTRRSLISLRQTLQEHGVTANQLRGLIPLHRLPERLYDQRKLQSSKPPSNLRVAPEFLRQLNWSETLRHADEKKLRGVIAVPSSGSDQSSESRQDRSVWDNMASVLSRLYLELGQAGKWFDDVLELTKEPSLRDRWISLTALAADYQARMESNGLIDPVDARRRALEANLCRYSGRVVLVGTHAIPKLTAKLLENANCDVESLIMAPPSFADHFDSVGAVDPHAWQSIELPIGDDWLCPADDIVDQSDCAASLVFSLADQVSNQNEFKQDQSGSVAEAVTVVATDSSFEGPLEFALDAIGQNAHRGSGVSFLNTSPGRLLESIDQYFRLRSWAALARLVRHPDVLSRLSDQLVVQGQTQSQEEWLTALDHVLANHYPVKVADPLPGHIQASQQSSSSHSSSKKKTVASKSKPSKAKTNSAKPKSVQKSGVARQLDLFAMEPEVSTADQAANQETDNQEIPVKHETDKHDGSSGSASSRHENAVDAIEAATASLDTPSDSTDLSSESTDLPAAGSERPHRLSPLQAVRLIPDWLNEQFSCFHQSSTESAQEKFSDRSNAALRWWRQWFPAVEQDSAFEAMMNSGQVGEGEATGMDEVDLLAFEEDPLADNLDSEPVDPLTQRAQRLAARWFRIHQELPPGLDPVMSLRAWFDRMRRSLGSISIVEDQQPSQLSIVGWHEGMFCTTPAMVVVGFNHPYVPLAVTVDPFLPGSLRAQLGVEDNASQLARDAYAAVAIRSSNRACKFIVGKFSPDGSPTPPSRILALADAGDVARRMVRVLGKRSETESPLRHHRFDDHDPRQTLAIPQPDGQAGKAIEVMSVTSFKNYLECPYRFYLRHVEKCRPLEDSNRELAANQFGDLIHNALESFGKSAHRDSKDETEIKLAMLDAIDQIAEETYGSGARAAVQIQVSMAKKRIEIVAMRQAERSREGWRIKEVEASVDEDKAFIMVDGKRMGLRGRFDRIDHHPESGRWAILDYKTHSDPPEKKHLKTKQSEETWIDLQLPLYQMMIPFLGIQATPDQVDLGYFNIADKAKQTKINIAKFSTRQMESAQQRIRSIVQSIWNGEFSPAEESPQYDDYAMILQPSIDLALSVSAVTDDGVTRKDGQANVTGGLS